MKKLLKTWIFKLNIVWNTYFWRKMIHDYVYVKFIKLTQLLSHLVQEEIRKKIDWSSFKSRSAVISRIFILFIVTQATHLHRASTWPFITQSWSWVHAHILANDLSTIQSGVVVIYAALITWTFNSVIEKFTLQGFIRLSI